MSYQQLTLEERFVIYHLRLVRLSVREIARRLNRHHSTISRELKRNGALSGRGVLGAERARVCTAAKTTGTPSSSACQWSAVPVCGGASSSTLVSRDDRRAPGARFPGRCAHAGEP